MGHGQVAIITGAGRGVGRAAAHALAREGYALALVSRTKADLDITKRDIEKSIVLPADISDAQQVADVVSKMLAHFGRLDAIVHCAGIAPLLSIEETTPEDWRAILDTNLSAAFQLAREAWPIFRKQGGGVIVNISSLAARDPFPGFSAYGAAKAGLNLLGLALAREGQEIGVRVHTLMLGAVETGMFRKIRTPEQWPSTKTLDPADVAATIVQCVRGDLRYTSGEVITLHKSI
jgi:NAD(P)-dependent dehydrogenase (short-subunit alcohol dehydrogenase family)